LLSLYHKLLQEAKLHSTLVKESELALKQELNI